MGPFPEPVAGKGASAIRPRLAVVVGGVGGLAAPGIRESLKTGSHFLLPANGDAATLTATRAPLTLMLVAAGGAVV